MIYRKIIKPAIDFILASVAFIAIFPVFLILILLLFVFNQGRVFFIQKRPGINHKPFSIIKFKTMTDAKDNKGNLLPDEQRLTVIGRFIRNTSLDEVPQLLNVIVGDMSLIGPRPLLVGYLSLYSRDQARRHLVRPGITGWAQVNGRNAISWENKFKLDTWYVDNISFKLDCKILYLTILKVFKREGISSSTSATMEEFKGNKANE